MPPENGKPNRLGKIALTCIEDAGPSGILGNFTASGIAEFTECPYPSVAVENPSSSEPQCAMSCPHPSYARSRWEALARAQWVIGTVSTILMAIICFYYASHPILRTTSSRILLYWFVSILLMSLAFLMGGSDPIDNAWCDGPTRPGKNARCTAQGFLIVVFAFSYAIWSCITSIALTRQISFAVENKHFDVLRYEKRLSLIAWGIPILLGIIFGASGLYQFSYLDGICIIHSKNLADQGFFTGSLIYWPIDFVGLIAIIWWIIASIKVFKQIRKANIAASNPIYLANLRLLAWGIISSLCMIYSIWFHFHLMSIASSNNTETSEWFACSVRQSLTADPLTSCRSKPPNPDAILYACIYWSILASLGIYTFACFGTRWTVMMHYYVLLSYVFRLEWDELKSFITNEAIYKRVIEGRSLSKLVVPESLN